MTTPALSIVIPSFNEAASIEEVVKEAVSVFEAGLESFEIIVVDDGSDDDTAGALGPLSEADPRVRVIRHPNRSGKSAGLRTGFLAARAIWVATMDGDGQNDPADLPDMLEKAWAAEGEAPLVAGTRVRRNDPVSRLVATRIANGFRAAVLGDHCPDTGCGVKVFPREAFLMLPCFEGMHRFLPALFQRYGHPLINHPVRHRARHAGQSKYTNIGRAFVGIFDTMGVIWLVRRTKAPGRIEERRP